MISYGILADIVVLIHLLFVIFAALGAGLILWRRWFVWLHLPAVLWAIWIELTGGICPLTPLENWLRHRAGSEGYRGDFVDHYLMPLLYPGGLTRNLQVLLGLVVLLINLALYGYLVFQIRRRK
jgi:hypothetical protein